MPLEIGSMLERLVLTCRDLCRARGTHVRTHSPQPITVSFEAHLHGSHRKSSVQLLAASGIWSSIHSTASMLPAPQPSARTKTSTSAAEPSLEKEYLSYASSGL